MKKVLSLMLVICMLFALTACGNGAGEQKAAAGPSTGLSAGPGQQSDSGGNSQVPEGTGDGQEDAKIDVDLTKLSSTMVYSEVYNMLNTPEDYIGKTVKMNGVFNLYCQRMDTNGQPDFDYPIYYACVIADAAACCSQGLEFVLAGDSTYPDDYPELGVDITVIGTFETYEEDGNMYCHLVNAKMTV